MNNGLSAAIAVATMVGMGTTLRAVDFWGVIRWPRAVLLCYGAFALIVSISEIIAHRYQVGVVFGRRRKK